MVNQAPHEFGIGSPWRRLLFCARWPKVGFENMAAEHPRLGNALIRMLCWRTPLALAELVLGWMSFTRLYKSVGDPTSEIWRTIGAQMPPELSVGEIQDMLRMLPPLPEFTRVLPWLMLLAPIFVLSLWLHDAVWDHGSLWILRGLKEKKSFRISMIADAEALSVGSLGAALGLLVNLPVLGWLFLLPAMAAGTYFWLLRGFSLAAFHDCPLWKGVVATLLHLVLMLVLALLFLALLGALLFLQVG
jgi:hypothetical protein